MSRTSSLSPTVAPVLERAIRHASHLLQGVAFWSAVALPFLYVPLLVGWPWSGEVTVAFGALLAANVAAVIAGHGYKQGAEHHGEG